MASAGTSLQLFEAVEPHMGTLVKIKLYARDGGQARAAFRASFDRIARLDSILSDYQADSELNLVCRSAVGRPVQVSRALFRVLEAAERLAEQSDGAFDVTLGPVIRLWREARKRGRLPDSEALRKAAARCGYRKLHLDAAKQTVMLDLDGMQLDLGGIAKGYAADAALEETRRLGIRSALVAMSGDLAFSDAPPGQRGWKIGAGTTDRVLVLRNCAVSTSGDAEQYLDIDGKRYSHIIDPKTNAGLTGGVVVTIVARRGMEADGLATAVSVMGLERGRRLAQKYHGRIANPPPS